MNILDHSGRSGYICSISRGSMTPSKTRVSVAEDYVVMVKNLKGHSTEGRGKKIWLHSLGNVRCKMVIQRLKSCLERSIRKTDEKIAKGLKEFHL